MEVGGIGSTKLGMGNILNIVIPRAHFKIIGISVSHHKLCFSGHILAEIFDAHNFSDTLSA